MSRSTVSGSTEASRRASVSRSTVRVCDRSTVSGSRASVSRSTVSGSTEW